MNISNLKQKAVDANQFYGKRELLNLFQQIHKFEADRVNRTGLNCLLSAAWNSCSTEEDKALFWLIVFSSGDISNREHNLFKRAKISVDGGGNSTRNVFFWSSVWALSNEDTSLQWYSFLDLIPEYTNWENLFYNGIRTDRKTGKIEEERILPIDTKLVAKYIAKVISNPKTPTVTHQLLSKFLDKPRTSKRQNKIVISTKNITSLSKALNKDLQIGETVIMRRNLQVATQNVMQFKSQLATDISALLNWEIIEYPNNKRFKGLEEYKALWNRSSEAYLFSSKEILKYDEITFNTWLDSLSAGARYRVQCRLLNKEGDKFITTGKWISSYGDLATFYLNWLTGKEKSQEKLRNLTEDQLADLSVTEVKQLQKDAKVNVGANTLIDVVAEFFKGGSTEQEINVKAQAILDKIKVDVPVLVITDVSGSMSQRSILYKNASFTPMNMAQLATTIFLLKNPNEELSSFFIRFDSKAEIIVDGTIGIDRPNRFMAGKDVKVETLINKKKSFLDNFKNIQKQIFARSSTNFSSVAEELKRWVDIDPQFRDQKIEIINSYPVWLVMSDGDLNNSYNPAASFIDFKMKMRQWFGANPVVVIWDCKQVEDDSSGKFDNIEDFMYFSGFNASILNQVFCKISDLDIIDVYSPLLSLFKSERYSPVKNRVLQNKMIKTNS